MKQDINNAKQLLEKLDSRKKPNQTEVKIRKVLIRQFLEETKMLIELNN
jgi:hypothetical protein